MSLVGPNQQTTLLLRKLDELRLFTYVINEGELEQVRPYVSRVVKNIAQSDISLAGYRLSGVRTDGSDLIHKQLSTRQLTEHLARYLSGAASRLPLLRRTPVHALDFETRVQRIHHAQRSIDKRNTSEESGTTATKVYDDLSLAFKRASLVLHGSVASASREFNSRFVARLQNSAAPTVGQPNLPSDGNGIDAEVAEDAFFFVVKGVVNPSYSPMFFAVIAL